MVKNKNLMAIAYLVLLLVSIVTLSYKETGAKYFKEDLNKLNYGVKFKKMTGHLNVGHIYTDNDQKLYEFPIEESDEKNLKYIIDFNTSNNMNDDDIEDIYNISLLENVKDGNNIDLLENGNCSIVFLNTTGVEPDSISDDRTEIVYGKNDSNEGTIRAIIKCDVSSLKDLNPKEFDFSINIKEKFNEETLDYLYISHNDKIDLEKYTQGFSDKPTPPHKNYQIEIPISSKEYDSEKTYEELIKKLQSHISKSYSIDNDNIGVGDYLNLFYTDNDKKLDNTNVDNFKNLEYGISDADYIDNGDNTGYFGFNLNDNFSDYVMTYLTTKTIDNGFKSFCFSDTTSDLLFEKYVKEYDIPGRDDFIKSINNYENDSLPSIIELSKVFDMGITQNTNVNKCYIVPNNLSNILTNKIKLTNSSSISEMTEKFSKLFVNYDAEHKALFIDEETKSKIENYLSKFFIGTQSYDNYNVFFSNNKKMLVHVSEDNGIVSVEIEFLNNIEQGITFDWNYIADSDPTAKSNLISNLEHIVNKLYSGSNDAPDPNEPGYTSIFNFDELDKKNDFTDLVAGDYEIKVLVDTTSHLLNINITQISDTISDTTQYKITLLLNQEAVIQEPELDPPIEDPEVNDNPDNPEANKDSEGENSNGDAAENNSSSEISESLVNGE